jgi:hypothetical protein
MPVMDETSRPSIVMVTDDDVPYVVSDARDVVVVPCETTSTPTYPRVTGGNVGLYVLVFPSMVSSTVPVKIVATVAGLTDANRTELRVPAKVPVSAMLVAGYADAATTARAVTAASAWIADASVATNCVCSPGSTSSGSAVTDTIAGAWYTRTETPTRSRVVAMTSVSASASTLVLVVVYVIPTDDAATASMETPVAVVVTSAVVAGTVTWHFWPARIDGTDGGVVARSTGTLGVVRVRVAPSGATRSTENAMLVAAVVVCAEDNV